MAPSAARAAMLLLAGIGAVQAFVPNSAGPRQPSTSYAKSPALRVFAMAETQTAADPIVEQQKVELIALCESCPKNGVGASPAQQEAINIAVDDLAKFCPSQPALQTLTGVYDLVYCATTGGSSGKVGPFVGDVTQTFVDEKQFINAVTFLGGALRIALLAERTILGDEKIQVDFKETTVSLFGLALIKKVVNGRGVWQQRYVDSTLRVMNTPSIFVLRKRNV